MSEGRTEERMEGDAGATEENVQVTLMGTGTSTGIPVIGCRCRVCTSKDPRDRRMRCSAKVVANGVTMVIDTGPDFRRQALRERMRHVDAVLFTHHHFDHVVGLDDLRPFFFFNKAAIPCYARDNTAAILRGMFHYIFADGSYPGVPTLTLREVSRPFEVSSRRDSSLRVPVIPIDVWHGDMPLFGYRIGRFAYLTDTNLIPESSYELLHDLDVLVLDALRHEHHPTHFTIDEAVEVAQRIGAGQTYLIHMTHSILHAEEEVRLPEGVALGYDGLTFATGW
ncbi:MAG: MBL fold metallo-hydrolase [Rhodothermales bacterium]